MRITHWLISALAVLSLVAAAAAESSSRSWWRFGAGKSQPAAKTKTATGTSKAPMITKVSDSTKRWVSGTKDMLSLKKPTATKRSGNTAVVPRKNPKDEKPGFFKSLFNPEPPPPPKTVKEWMKLKQIHP